VDDEPDLIELISFNLASNGYDVIAATTGLGALHQARRHLPDLILLDIMLEGMDGLSVCEILRNQPSTAKTPVIFVSALGGEMARLNGLTSGGNDFIHKPFSPRELLRRVEAMLDQKHTKAGAKVPGTF
jgi:DNA-binding response OmpR family regulator